MFTKKDLVMIEQAIPIADFQSCDEDVHVVFDDIHC
jgi:hypothetical protein